MDNLTPYKPGQSGNPNGKPKGTKNRSTILREILELEASDGKTYEYKIDKALIDKALDGDIPAIKEIKDSVHGKITDTSFNINAETKEEALPAEEMKAIAAQIAKDLQEKY